MMNQKANKLYATLEVEGITTEEQYNEKLKYLWLDDIQFFIPNKEDGVYVHLDYNEVEKFFKDGKIHVRLKDLADTHVELNEEYGISNDDITLELLSKGEIVNYIIFVETNSGDIINDVNLVNLAYDKGDEYHYFSKDEDCCNEAGLD